MARFVITVMGDKGCIADCDAPTREDAVGEVMPTIEKALLEEEWLEVEIFSYKKETEEDDNWNMW